MAMIMTHKKTIGAITVLFGLIGLLVTNNVVGVILAAMVGKVVESEV